LSSEALKRLTEKLPASFKETSTEKTLFALERFSLIPLVAKGETPVKVSLRLIFLEEVPEKLFLLLRGQEYPLEKRQGGYWDGEIKAPKREGDYYPRLKLITKTGKIFFLNTASYLKVDNTPPRVQLSYENSVFSPNVDESKDVLIVFPRLVGPEELNLWGFYIFDEREEPVRRFEGSGDLPLAWAWHGENDEFVNLKDGTYYLECRCLDKAGNVAVTTRKRIILDNTRPKLNVSIDAEKNRTWFNIKYEEDTAINQWKLMILNENDDIYYDIKREGGIPPQVEVPFTDKKGLYFLMEALDAAGNKTELKGSLASQQMAAGEKPEEEEKKPSVWDEEF
jgi:hypothetical protein